METTEFFEYTPFVNEECGDTMWNEENLNPPKSSDEKKSILAGLIKEIVQKSSMATSK